MCCSLLQNSLEDLYSLLRVEPWCNLTLWQKLIQRPYENGDPRSLELAKADTFLPPPIDIQLIECEQSESERDFYEALFERSEASFVQFDQYVAQGKVLHHYANILDLLMQLRRCCNHPFLVMCGSDTQKRADLSRHARRFLQTNTECPEESNQNDPRQQAELNKLASRLLLKSASSSHSFNLMHTLPRECLYSCWGTSAGGKCPICRQLLQKDDLITYSSESPFKLDVKNNVTESSKVSKLFEFLQRILNTSSEKSIVFSQWTSFFYLLENSLRRKGIGFLRYDGKLTQKQREKVLDEFNQTREKRVMLMSLKAGGMGLNLTAASNVFIMDTVEDRLQQVQARKQRLISGTLTDDEVRTARIQDLKMLFTREFIYLEVFSLTNTLHFSSRRRSHALPRMAESHRTRPSRRQPSRLQSRAPSSLQINRTVEWNVAIPLLSPLVSSPPPPPQKDEPPPPQQQRPPEKVVFKKWQHPAAPFCYEPPSLVPPFVNV
ncbi:DNA repair protein RAD5B [Glycine soja]|uniref:DNA repair protein RAD5B n=2 Tax=Glycine soja TaxID=3848 RepID=A0A445IG28_GLYSO|nr:DNA repair protein RAD5B [Glycine soja]